MYRVHVKELRTLHLIAPGTLLQLAMRVVFEIDRSTLNLFYKGSSDSLILRTLKIHLVFFIRDIKIFGIGLSLNFFINMHSPVPNFVPYFSPAFYSLYLKTVTTIP